MRLTKDEVLTIKSAVLKLDSKAKVFLFGSRVHDHKKGGDIDILILSEKLNFLDKAKIKTFIFEHLEEQRIDITIAKDDSDPFVKIALEEGIAL
ncbi:MAG: nucleotidyltransferase domain-containing protein [Chlamydiales bacterium]|nr:nucleotidyltransferase domain-containing protein [Chlamydiales bacterium]